MAAEISFAWAAVGGFVSFLSPCVLPLVPAYLSYMAGTNFDEMNEKAGKDPALTRRVVLMAVFFVLGFSTVFVALGASASAINAVIVLFGLHMIGLLRIGLFYREARFAAGTRNLKAPGAYLLGMAFGFGWTPCIGPILATILALAASEQNVTTGAALLAVYALGLGIPFLLAALAVRAFMGFLVRFRRHLHKVEVGTGLLLIVTGVLIFTNQLQILAIWLLELFPGLATIG